MKKLFNLLFISILTILLIPNVYAKDDVSIESITLVDKSEKTVELSNPTKNGLKIGFDLTFSDVGDYAKYEVVVNNDTNKEYELNDETKFSTSNYIEYKYDFKEQTNRVKANSKVTLYITVTYKNPVPADKLTDGKYIENNEMALTLLNEENPKTFNNYIYLIFILLSLIVISLLIRNKKVKSLSIIVIALLLVPTTIFALEKLKLDVSTKITIEKKYKVTFVTNEVIKLADVDKYRLLLSELERGTSKVGSRPVSTIEEKMFINNEEYDYVTIIKEERFYKAGETVEAKNYSIQTINSIEACTLQETTDPDSQPYNKIICPESVLVNVNTDIGFYTSKYNSNIHENDLQTMSFQNIQYNNWEENKKMIAFQTPSTFKMPEHDVVIDLEILSMMPWH